MKQNKGNKKNKELRRQLEALRAQVKSNTPLVSASQPAVSISTTAKTPQIDTKKAAQAELQESQLKYLRTDILKTLTLSAVAFSVILVLWAQTN